MKADLDPNEQMDFRSSGTTNEQDDQIDLKQTVANLRSQLSHLKMQLLMAERCKDESTQKFIKLTQKLATEQERNKQLQELNRASSPSNNKSDPSTSDAFILKKRIDELGHKLAISNELRKQLASKLAKKERNLKAVHNEYNENLDEANQQIEADRAKIDNLEQSNLELKRDCDFVISKNKALEAQDDKFKVDLSKAAGPQKMDKILTDCRVIELEEQTRDLNAELDKLKSNHSKQRLLLEAAKIHTSKLEHQVTELTTQNNARECQIQEIEKARQQENDWIHTLEESNAGLNNKLQELDGARKRDLNVSLCQLNNLGTQNQRHLTTIANLESQVKFLENALAAQASEFLALQTHSKDCLDKTSNLNDQIKNQEIEVANKSAEISNLKERVGKLERRNFALKRELRNNPESTSQESDQNNEQIEHLKARQQRSTQKIIELEKLLKAREVALTVKTTQMHNLKNQHTQGLDEMAVLSNKIQKEICDSNASKVYKLERQNDKLKNELYDLQETIEQQMLSDSESLENKSTAQKVQPVSNKQLNLFISNGREKAEQIKREVNEKQFDSEDENPNVVKDELNKIINILKADTISASTIGNHAKALEHIYTSIGIRKHGLKSKRHLANLWNDAGIVFTSLKCHRKAFECYSKAIKCYSLNSTFYYNRAYTRVKLHSFKNAKKICTKSS